MPSGLIGSKATPFSQRARRGLTVAHRLMLIVLVVAVPMLLLSAGIVWRLDRRERDTNRDAIMYASRSVIGAVDAQLGKYIAIAQSLAASPSLQADDIALFRNEAKRALPGLPNAWVSIADLDGRQLVNTSPMAAVPPPPIPPEGMIAQALAFKTGRFQVVDVSIGPATKIPVVAVVVPVFRDGLPFRSVFIPVDVGIFRDLLNSQRLPAGWLAAIVDGSGNLIARSLDHDRWVGKQVSPGWQPFIKQEGWFDTRSLEGEAYTTANAVSPLSGWTMGVAAKRDLLEAPARQTLMFAILIGVLVTLVSIALATQVARQITRPIEAMENGARALRHNEPVHYAPTGVPEVDHALDAFDTASRELRAHEVSRATAEAALRASEERYERLANATKEGVLICADEHIVEANAGFARMVGCGGDEAIGKSLGDFLDLDMREAALDRLRRSEGEAFETVALRRDGRSFPIELSGSAVTYNGRDMRVALMRDLTIEKSAEEDRRALQAELMRASRLSEIGRMAAALAHELNQPLTAVASYIGGCRRLLRGDTSDPEVNRRLREVMDLANAQALRAGEVIRRTREFFGTGQTKRTVEDAAIVMREASTLAIATAKHNGIAIRADIAPAGHVLVDKVQIQQVIVNLVRNGIEAMENSPKKELVIKLEGRPDSIELSVSDSGAGVSPEIADRLFKPFSSTKSQGMGIGLSVCREIVEAHEGKIWAEPQPGGGAVFRFTLPLVSAETAALSG